MARGLLGEDTALGNTSKMAGWILASMVAGELSAPPDGAENFPKKECTLKLTPSRLVRLSSHSQRIPQSLLSSGFLHLHNAETQVLSLSTEESRTRRTKPQQDPPTTK